MDGFYEWKREGESKRPFYFQAPDADVMAFAGIYERWSSSEGEVVASCAIVTTDANDDMRTIHHRMPVILSDGAAARWLDPVLQDRSELEELLQPAESGALGSYEVSSVVNSPMNDDPRCVEPLEAAS